MAASDSLPAGYPLPGSSPVIGRLAPAPIRRRRTGEGLPSSRRHLPHVPRPLRREVLRGCASRLFSPSMAFALTAGARLLLVPTMRWVCSRRGRLRFMLRTAWSLPLKGFRHRAPARPVSRPDRRSATGPPGSYPDRTFTGRRRRACLRTDQIILHRPSTSGRTPSLIEVGEPSGEGEVAPPERPGRHDALAEPQPRRPAGEVVRDHLHREPGRVRGEAARGQMVQPDAVLEVTDRVLDLA